MGFKPQAELTNLVLIRAGVAGCVAVSAYPAWPPEAVVVLTANVLPFMARPPTLTGEGDFHCRFTRNTSCRPPAAPQFDVNTAKWPVGSTFAIGCAQKFPS